MNWEDLGLTSQLSILSGETLIAHGVLAECEELMTKLKAGCTKEQAITVINNHF